MEKLTQEYVDRFFPSVEGELIQICGKIKNGKTLLATNMIFNDLMAGYTVAANWHVDWQGYDERNSKWKLFLGLIGLKKVYANIPKENFIYLDPTDYSIVQRLAHKTDLKVYLDEGHKYFDSYVAVKEVKMESRLVILETAHFNRTFVICSQRPTAIQPTFRGNVNRFFKIEKIMTVPLLKWSRYQVIETQDMVSEMPDWENYDQAFAFWGRRYMYARYNFKEMRGGIPRSQPNYAILWRLRWNEIRQRLFGLEIDQLLDTPPLPPT